MKKIQVVYFSPSGTTEKITKRISEHFTGEVVYHDILLHKLEKKVNCSAAELLILGMPVFGGRVPAYCLSSLKRLRGENTPAIIVAVYGNRAYEDTLVEMEDILEAGGFKIVGAGAFIGAHSIFNEVAKGRPDETDFLAIDDFGMKAAEKVQAFSVDSFEKLSLPGNRPYRDYMGNSLVPEGSKACSNCRTCVGICPVGAISGEHPRKTDKKKCIMCTACIAHCPKNARAFGGAMYAVASKKFNGANKNRKEPETFL